MTSAVSGSRAAQRKAGVYMKRKMHSQGLAAALCLILCVFCLAPSASAITAIPQAKLDADCSLTLRYALSGVKFSVYKVADVKSNVAFVPVGRFSAYPVKMDGLDSRGWRTLAETLDGYVAHDSQARPVKTETTAGGIAVFDGLDAGLYLVTGENKAQNGLIYTPTAFLICLPNWQESSQGGRWINDVTAAVKYETVPEDETISIRALKSWDDSGKRANRPSEVTVALMRGNTVYDTVTLSAKNNWYYDWSGLSAQYRWRVVEVSGSDGYWVTTSQEGITYVVTNHAPGGGGNNNDGGGGNNPPPDPGIPIEDMEVPLSDPPFFDEPWEPGGDEIIIDDLDIPLSDLPQTGQLWWPVPFLALGGMFLTLTGWALNRRSEQDEE